MIIESIDFVAEETDAEAFFKASTHESFSAAKSKMNAWLSTDNVEVINVETVVLPSLHSPHEEGSEDVAINVKSEFVTTYSQFIRVWYKKLG